MKRRFLLTALAVTLSLGMVACGSESMNNDTMQNEEVTMQNEEEVNEELVNEELETDSLLDISNSTLETEELVNEEADSSLDISDSALESEEETMQNEELANEEVDSSLDISNSTLETEDDNSTFTNYTFADMSATLFAKSQVNVRDLPSKDGNKVGSLSMNDEVAVTGKCNETGWYRFELNGAEAYVSNAFLVSEKVVVEEKPAQSETTVAETPAQTEIPASSGTVKCALLPDNYEYFTWYEVANSMVAVVPMDSSNGWAENYNAPGFDSALATVQSKMGDSRNYIEKSWCRNYPAKGYEIMFISTALHSEDGSWHYYREDFVSQLNINLGLSWIYDYLAN